MKCLYCGKELAIFKRLSGSEFCSDGHRKQYQQEYNQLALSRLLHSQPAGQKTVAREQTALVPNAGELPKRTEQPRTDPRADIKTAFAPTTPARHAPATSAPNGIPRKFTTPPPPKAIPMPGVSKTSAAAPPAPSAAPVPAARVAPPAPPVTPQAPAPVQAPPPQEAKPPAPMAGMLDFKPSLRLGATATASGAVIELLEANLQPERPEVRGEQTHFHLKNAENIPLEFGFVEPHSGNTSTESRPEARDFARPVPRIEMSYAVLIPAFGPLKERLPIALDARASEPASVWIFGGLPYVGTIPVERGTLAEASLHPVGLDVLDRQSSDAPQHVASSGHQGHLEPLEEQNAAGFGEPDLFAHDKLESSPAEGNATDAITNGMAEPMEAGSAQSSSPAQDAPTINERERNQAGQVLDWDNLSAPSPVTKPMLVVPRAAAAGKAKPVQVFQATLATAPKVEIPRYDVLPLRPVIFVAPAPDSKASTPPATPAEHSKKLPSAPRHEQAASVIAPQNPAAKAEPAPSAAARKTPAPAGATRKPSQSQGKANATDETVKSKTADAVSGPKVTLQPGKPIHKPVDPRLTGGPKAGTPDDAKITAPAPKPSGTPFGNSDLSLPQLHIGPSRMPSKTVMFAAGGVAALLAIVLLVFYVRGSSSTNAVAAPSALKSTTIGVGPDWIENFSPDPGHPRTISILRSTSKYKDYRIEMEAQIDTKALGWIFRAVDPNNFYVGKIEVRREGAALNPFLVHYAVINGVPDSPKQVPLPFAITPSTIYRLRFEAIGNRFTTYVQDRKVEVWTDSRLPSGGAGLYSDSGERAILQSGFDVTPTEKTN